MQSGVAFQLWPGADRIFARSCGLLRVPAPFEIHLDQFLEELTPGGRIRAEVWVFGGGQEVRDLGRRCSALPSQTKSFQEFSHRQIMGRLALRCRRYHSRSPKVGTTLIESAELAVAFFRRFAEVLNYFSHHAVAEAHALSDRGLL